MNITGFCPITRKNRVESVINQLIESGVDEILLIVDSTAVTKAFVESKIPERYRDKIRLKFTNQAPPSSFNIGQRRNRIARVMMKMRDLVKTEYVYMIEDDTEAPANALERLKDNFISLDNVGLVSGVQAGRWGIKMIGGWVADNPNDMKKLESVSYSEVGIQEVTASGFYCFLTKTEYLKYGFQVNNFGPDINYGIELAKRGLMSYLDWGIITKHITDNGAVEVGKDCCQIEFNLRNGIWKQTIKF